MIAYRLLWELLKHVLRGRGRDEVCVSVGWDTASGYGGVAGTVTDFSWESDEDAFLMLDATSQDGPYSDSNDPESVRVRT